MAKGERSVRYKRILLKLSGEALAGTDNFGISPQVLDRMALEIGQLVGIGVQVGLVIGVAICFEVPNFTRRALIVLRATTWGCLRHS